MLNESRHQDKEWRSKKGAWGHTPTRGHLREIEKSEIEAPELEVLGVQGYLAHKKPLHSMTLHVQ